MRVDDDRAASPRFAEPVEAVRDRERRVDVRIDGRAGHPRRRRALRRPGPRRAPFGQLATMPKGRSPLGLRGPSPENPASAASAAAALASARSVVLPIPGPSTHDEAVLAPPGPGDADSCASAPPPLEEQAEERRPPPPASSVSVRSPSTFPRAYNGRTVSGNRGGSQGGRKTGVATRERVSTTCTIAATTTPGRGARQRTRELSRRLVVAVAVRGRSGRRAGPRRHHRLQAAWADKRRAGRFGHERGDKIIVREGTRQSTNVQESTSNDSADRLHVPVPLSLSPPTRRDSHDKDRHTTTAFPDSFPPSTGRAAPETTTSSAAREPRRFAAAPATTRSTRAAETTSSSSAAVTTRSSGTRAKAATPSTVRPATTPWCSTAPTCQSTGCRQQRRLEAPARRRQHHDGHERDRQVDSAPSRGLTRSPSTMAKTAPRHATLDLGANDCQADKVFI